MTQPWKIAAVQMDCRLGDKPHNLRIMKARLVEAAASGARLAIFPECTLSGYCFENKEEALAHSEPLPGPSSEEIKGACRELGVSVIYGLLERQGSSLYNSLALVGPGGLLAVYRKVHLPFLGVDRFAERGPGPFVVHELDGLRLGMLICYDGGFPEASRCLALQGADLIVLPTNWPPAAIANPLHVVVTRALENHVYFAAVNRVGTERGVRFIGMSRIIGPTGKPLAVSESDREETLYADIDPVQARRKRIVHEAGKYELDRIGDRRPELYSPLVQDGGTP